MEKNEKQNIMGTAPIGKLLLKMSLPTTFSMLINALYNIVDSIFVAKISEDALAAVSLAMPLQFLIIAISVGTGIGVGSLMSRKLGEKNFDEVNLTVNHGVILGFLSYIAVALLGAFGTQYFFQFFTNDPVLLDLSITYTRIVLVGSLGSFIAITIEKILQGAGNMTYPMIFQLMGAIINIILDPILIFGYFGVPKMGIAGAAIATVIGQICSMFFAIYVITHKNFGFDFTLKGFKFDTNIVKKIYQVGFPSIIMQSVSSFLTILLNGILIDISVTAVSIMGIYGKLQSFVFMPVFGLNQGLMPLFGYNFGARNKERVLKVYKLGVISATVIMVIGTIIFQVFPETLLSLFDANANMIEIGVPALRIISLCFILAGVDIINSTAFQAVGNGKISLMISLLRQVIVILPVAYIGSKFFGIIAVWYAYPIAELVALIVGQILLIKLYERKIKVL